MRLVQIDIDVLYIHLCITEYESESAYMKKKLFHLTNYLFHLTNYLIRYA